jgi:hypothetical protein
MKLKKTEIVTDDKSEKWISTYREKTKTLVKVPLLKMAFDILENISITHYVQVMNASCQY